MPFIKFWWDRVDGILLDDKFVERKWDAGSKRHFVIRDYAVETNDREGRPVRLVIRDRALFLDLPPRGSSVPLRVNRKRTKAAFDRYNTSIDPSANLDEHDRQQRAADEARFEATLRDVPNRDN
jgi:hypothetical protein